MLASGLVPRHTPVTSRPVVPRGRRPAEWTVMWWRLLQVASGGRNFRNLSADDPVLKYLVQARHPVGYRRILARHMLDSGSDTAVYCRSRTPWKAPKFR